MGTKHVEMAEGEEMPSAGDLVKRLCKLQEEVRTALGLEEPCDCFCGDGGYWSCAPDDYGPTPEKGFRNYGAAVASIERVVREALTEKGIASAAQS